MMSRSRILGCLGLAVGLSASPAFADYDASYGFRFGVGYQEGTNGQPGQVAGLYEGRYTARFSHQADNGIRFRFELGIIASNLDRPGHPYLPANGNANSGD